MFRTFCVTAIIILCEMQTALCDGWNVWERLPTAGVWIFATMQQKSSSVSHTQPFLLFSLDILFSPWVIKEKIWARTATGGPLR